MRNTPLRAFAKKSPLRVEPEKTKVKSFDYSKKADYSKEKLEKTTGAKIAKAIIPTSVLDLAPVGKAVKLGKMAYKYLMA